jgi:hypothetical protein
MEGGVGGGDLELFDFVELFAAAQEAWFYRLFLAHGSWRMLSEGSRGGCALYVVVATGDGDLDFSVRS